MFGDNVDDIYLTDMYHKLCSTVYTKQYILHVQVLLECYYIQIKCSKWENWNHLFCRKISFLIDVEVKLWSRPDCICGTLYFKFSGIDVINIVGIIYMANEGLHVRITCIHWPCYCTVHVYVSKCHGVCTFWVFIVYVYLYCLGNSTITNGRLGSQYHRRS